MINLVAFAHETLLKMFSSIENAPKLIAIEAETFADLVRLRVV